VAAIKKEVLFLVIFFMLCPAARAFINPNFTPVDMVRQSEQVFILEFKSVDNDGKAVAVISKALKGKTEQKELVLDLMAGALAEDGKEFISRIKEGQKEAVIFIGTFKVENVGVEGAGDQSMGFLHFGNQYSPWRWVNFMKGKKEIWDMVKVENYLLGTWSGSTEMLIRAVDYIQSDPDAVMPFAVGAEWGDKAGLGKIKGRVTALAPVDLLDNGRADLFAASPDGDHIYRNNGKAFTEVTAKLGLSSSSTAFAWGDLNYDGRLDLASWNGKELNIFFQKKDGTFEKKNYPAGEALKDGCLALSVFDRGGQGKSVLLAGTGASPVFLLPQADGSLKAEPLAEGVFPGKDLGEGGNCLAADFDGDGITDIIQLFSKNSLFYKGKTGGAFDAPLTVNIETGKGRFAACTGDFDADGLPDIFIASEDKCRIWQNLGSVKFVELIKLSGEISYMWRPGGVDVAVGDINNDGRQDIFISYATLTTQLFFNRGFRSFGHARELNIDQALPASNEGQQAGCLLDYNGDGALDMAVVLNNGEFWLFPRKVEETALSITAALSLSGAYFGPLTFTAWKDKRCLGSWTVKAGEPGAFIGMPEAGPVTLKWLTPDGKPAEKEVIVKNGPVRVILNKDK